MSRWKSWVRIWRYKEQNKEEWDNSLEALERVFIKLIIRAAQVNVSENQDLEWRCCSLDWTMRFHLHQISLDQSLSWVDHKEKWFWSGVQRQVLFKTYWNPVKQSLWRPWRSRASLRYCFALVTEIRQRAIRWRKKISSHWLGTKQ